MRARGEKTSKWMGIAFVLVCTASCANTNLTSTTQSHPSVISVDSTVTASPGPFGGLTPDILLANAPSGTQPNVGNAPSGGGYIFQMTWTSTGPAPSSWEVNFYSDDNAGSAPTLFQGGTTIQNGATLQYQSTTLAGNRMYQFQLVADIWPTGTNISGEVTYKTVTVNLKGIGGQ